MSSSLKPKWVRFLLRTSSLQSNPFNFPTPNPDATLAEGGISLSPPFIIATAISPTGVLAVGTADGRLCIFFGGEKHPSKKKSKKWGGLNRDEMLAIKVAEGPIVAL
jgi:hypothetical protein